MSKLNNIKVLMDKTLHHVPKILTSNLIKHKNVKGTKVVKRESLETFNYRRAFYTTTAIALLMTVGIGYGIFAAMNIGLTKEEVKANLLNNFNNNNVADILDRKEEKPLTYVFNKGFESNKVYTFTGAGDSRLEHDVTSSIYHVENTTPLNVPTTVKRAYSKEDVEANYIKSMSGVELDGLLTDRERNPNTYILKKEFDEKTVYAFAGTETETQEQPVTSNVYHVEDNNPEFVPSTVQRAYSKEDVENNYVKKLKGNTLRGLKTRSEVNPNEYILKDEFNSNEIYTTKGNDSKKEIIKTTSSILYKDNVKSKTLPEAINTRGYAKEEIESTYIRPHGVNDLEGLETKSALNPKVFAWDYEFKKDTAYTFSGNILTKKAHVVTDNIYYISDKKAPLIPTDVKRAYSKKNVEDNYLLKDGEINLNGLNISYERNELSNAHVYSFSGGGVSKAKDILQITKDVHYIGDTRPTNVPNLVTRAYTAKEVEANYVLNLNNNNIGDIKALEEVNPDTYIKKNTLKSNIYYQTVGKNNKLKVNPLLIKKGEVYQATSQLNNSKDLTLKLFDFENKQYISGESDDGLYVLDNTDPHLLELKPVINTPDEAYDILGEGSKTNFKLTEKEELALDNKIKLFQKEKLTNPRDRYGNPAWDWDFSTWSTWSFAWDSIELLLCSKGYSYSSLLKTANMSLPKGAALTDRDIKHITDNMGEYKFRIWIGSSLGQHINSYGVLENGDGSEWDGVKLTSGKTQPAKFSPWAKTNRDDYYWEIGHNPKGQTLSITYQNRWSKFKKINDCRTAVRGIQVYKDSSFA